MSIYEKERVAPMPYGCDELGPLKSVMVHTPGEELELVDQSNRHLWSFEEVPDVDRFVAEHRQLVQTLEDNGVETFQLSECVEETSHCLRKLPSLTYLHDMAVVSGRGAILSRAAVESRRGEEAVVREALAALGVPVWHELASEEAFGGCLALSPRMLLVAGSGPHATAPMRAALAHFEEVLYVDVPRQPRFARPAAIFNMVAANLALGYPPALVETRLLTRDLEGRIDLGTYLRSRGITLIEVSDAEQRRNACSFLCLESKLLLQFEDAWDRSTLREFCRRGVDVIFFRPEALLAGGRGLHSMTLPLYRRPPCPVEPSSGGEWE